MGGGRGLGHGADVQEMSTQRHTKLGKQWRRKSSTTCTRRYVFLVSEQMQPCDSEGNVRTSLSNMSCSEVQVSALHQSKEKGRVETVASFLHGAFTTLEEAKRTDEQSRVFEMQSTGRNKASSRILAKVFHMQCLW
jgi:hypothetical protein